MGNWCMNKLIVRGNEAEVRRFKEIANGEDTELSLENLYPTPTDIDYGDFAWREINWGYSDDLEAGLIEERKKYLEYWFYTKNSYPIKWMGKVSKDFPTLSFKLKYIDELSIFKGITTVTKARNGNVTDNCKDY